MPEVRTDLVVNARTKGFQKSGQDAAKLGREGSKATQAIAKETKGLEGALKKLADEQVKVASAMVQAGDKGSAAYKKLADQLKRVQRESSGVEKTIRSLERAYGGMNEKARQAQDIQKKAQAQGGFAQGFMQASMPGAQFMQRGPGMWRQAAGVSAGGFARGAAMTPFSGAQGMAQALQSIPGGGMLAAPLMQSIGQAGQALQFRQMTQNLRPFLGGGALGQGTTTRGETSRQQRRRIAGGVDAELAARAAQVGSPEAHRGTGSLSSRVSVGSAVYDLIGKAFGGGVKGRLAREAQGRAPEAEGAGEPNLTQERQRMIDAAIAKEGVHRQSTRRRTISETIDVMGAKVGIASTEAHQIAAQITQAGGGRGRELTGQGLFGAAMGAKRLYGVDPGVAGAFLQGGRSGGVVGGMGRSGDALAEALASGVRLGLEGTELTEYMGQMAGDIRQWRTTGISINTDSMGAAAAGFAGMGFGGVRGAAMARGVYGHAREVSKGAPGGAEELMMLQTLGGFKGGSALDLEEAQLKLEEGGFGIGDIRRLAGRFMSAAGGGEKGRHVFRGTKMGKGMGIREVRLLQKQTQGGTLDETEQAMVDSALERARSGQAAAVGGGAEGLFAAGAGVTDEATKNQALIQNRQFAIGNAMITTMHNLERSTLAINKGFTTLAAGPLTALTGQIRDFSEEIPKATLMIRRMIAGGGGGIAGMIESTAAE